MEPVPVVENAKKKRGAPKGHTMTDAQRAGLAKGFEALKARREAMKKEKEAKANLPKVEPLPMPLPINNQEPVNKELVNPAPLVNVEVPKKTRNRVPAVSRDDFNSFKSEMINNLRPVSVAPVEKIVEKIVYTEPKILSGSALLDSIFFR